MFGLLNQIYDISLFNTSFAYCHSISLPAGRALGGTVMLGAVSSLSILAGAAVAFAV